MSPSAEIEIAPERPAGSPWGFWMTTIFSMVVALVYVLVAVFVAGLVIAIRHPSDARVNFANYIPATVSDGLYLSIASIATLILAGGLILLFAKLRKGIRVADYLGFRKISAAALSKWIVAALLFAALCDASSLILGTDIVAPFMSGAYASAGSLPLFWAAVVVAAPVFEELFFRGFIFAGWSASPIGPLWTILLTATGWAAIHQQYSFKDILILAAMGALLGAARWKTGSVYPPIIMHSATNLIATTEVWLRARGMI